MGITWVSMRVLWDRKIPVSLIVAGIMLGISVMAGYIHVVPGAAILIGLLNVTITLRK